MQEKPAPLTTPERERVAKELTQVALTVANLSYLTQARAFGVGVAGVGSVREDCEGSGTKVSYGKSSKEKAN